MSASPSRAARAALAAVALAVVGGCGYSIRPPYDPRVKTVYVPMPRTISFRRQVNIMLYETLIKEIEKRTPFKVVGTPEGADATLALLVNYVDKNLMVVNPNNLARQLNSTIAVEATFTLNRPDANPAETPAVLFSGINYFYPEIGETALTGFQKTVDNIVRQIVGMMEQPWGDLPPPPPEED